MTPAEKQKLWKLKNPSKTPRTGLTRLDHDQNAFVASTSTSSSGSGKCQVEEPVVKDDQPSDDVDWGRGRNTNHPAFGYQVLPRSNDN
jgi:hypothetical protein